MQRGNPKVHPNDSGRVVEHRHNRKDGAHLAVR
jgi:hypothetical protein